MVLSTAEALSDLQRCFAHLPEMESLEWVTTNTIPAHLADEWRKSELDRDSLAFLQYTSGSTALPKGVMITHGNLLHNLWLMKQHCEQTSESHMVSWLPPYHDMGLIGGILFPLYEGFPSTLMSPLAFLQQPFRWLQAISNSGATISVAPNFAYDLCNRKITAEQRATLDLSRWTLIANGAEPIRDETMKRFVETFAACGVRPEAFFPCYGLAEATLMVSSGKLTSPPVLRYVQRWALEQNLVMGAAAGDVDSWKLVGYDRILTEEQVVMVNPDTLTRCLPEQVGEIWIASPSVARGYWRRSSGAVPESPRRSLHLRRVGRRSVGSKHRDCAGVERARRGHPFGIRRLVRRRDAGCFLGEDNRAYGRGDAARSAVALRRRGESDLCRWRTNHPISH